MSAPTPGPWRLEQNSAGQWCVIGAGELVVCMFPPIVAEIADEQFSNMNAIVAASQMLVALQRLVPFVRAVDLSKIPYRADGPVIAAEIAIAVATGDTE